MHEYGSLPRARQNGLLEERVDEELLLYDQDSYTAHCLSPAAACVWRHCDGEHDLAELAALAEVRESLVADALYELLEKDLLDVEPQLVQNTIPVESRREAIGRVARYGAAAATGSLIVSATAATPAMASSGEKPKSCVGIIGHNHSCCLCEDGTCINSATVIDLASCEKECAKHGGVDEYASEGLC